MLQGLFDLMKTRFKFYAFKLCLLIVVVFAIQVFVPAFTELLVLNEMAFKEMWRFFSAIFLHGSLLHLAYNLFALALFGSILEKLIGSRKFLLIFFISGILANLISVNFYSSSLGASGAIFGIIGALVAIRPMLIVWAFGMPMPIFIAGVLWGIGDLLGAIGFLIGNPIDNTGNIAHLSGMFFGFIFGLLFRDFKRARKESKIDIEEKAIREWEDKYLR